MLDVKCVTRRTASKIPKPQQQVQKGSVQKLFVFVDKFDVVRREFEHLVVF